MTKAQEEAKRRAEIMLAFSEGAEIESFEYGVWRKASTPVWDWHGWDYRIKPQPREPRVIYVNLTKTPKGFSPHYGYDCPKMAETEIGNDNCTRPVVKFIEVIEEGEA